MANVPVTFAPGERLAHLGALVTAQSTRQFARGLRVRVHGTALTQGLVEVTRVRARPWSARLAPWQTCGWEHMLERDGESLCTTLRDAALPARGVAETPRQLLALAVWVELEGRALVEGEGTLTLELTPVHDEVERVCEDHTLRIQPEPPAHAVSAWLAWEGPLADRAEALRVALDRFARELARRTRGARALGVRGTARRALYLRAGCVVFGEGGLAGDARFEALWSGLADGRVERIQFVSPPRAPGLEATLSQAPRMRDAPVELVVSFVRSVPGRPLAPARDALLQLFERAEPLVGFVAEHPYAPSLADQTPFERARGLIPARTLSAMQTTPRIDPRRAHVYKGPLLSDE